MIDNQYKIVVSLGEEVFNLSASSAEEALDNAKQIIAEDYSGFLSDNATYRIEAINE